MIFPFPTEWKVSQNSMVPNHQPVIIVLFWRFADRGTPQDETWPLYRFRFPEVLMEPGDLSEQWSIRHLYIYIEIHTYVQTKIEIQIYVQVQIQIYVDIDIHNTYIYIAQYIHYIYIILYQNILSVYYVMIVRICIYTRLDTRVTPRM